MTMWRCCGARTGTRYRPIRTHIASDSGSSAQLDGNRSHVECRLDIRAAADGPARRDRDAGEAVVQRTPDIAHTTLKMEQDAKRNRAAPADDALRRRRRAWEEMQRV